MQTISSDSWGATVIRSAPGSNRSAMPSSNSTGSTPMRQPPQFIGERRPTGSRSTLTLDQDDQIARGWSSPMGRAFRAEAWGAQGGRGENAWEVCGRRLFVQRNTLLRLLQLTDLHLVGALKLRRYHRGESPGRGGDTRAFTHRSFVFALDPQGRVWAPRRILARGTGRCLDLDLPLELGSDLWAIVAQFRA